MAVPAYQAFNEDKSGGFSNSITITKPSGTAENDLLILVAALANAGTSPTDPSGFTNRIDNTSGATRLWVSWKKATGSEPANYTYSWTTAARCYGMLLRVDGQDLTTPFDITETVATGISAAPTAGAETTVTNDCLIIPIFAHDFNTSVDTGYPASTTGISVDNDGNVSSAGAAHFDLVAKGSTGARAFTASHSNDWSATNLCIRSASPSSSRRIFVS